jgi:DUF1365 family protein
MALLDLEELPEALDAHPLWSARRPAPIRFRSADLLGSGERQLGEVARELVRERSGEAPAGPVRVLASPRFLGFGFNPVRFVYLHGAGGGLEALVAEVTNTPWGERHSYVARRDPGTDSVRATFAKQLHVSPHMPMGQSYEIEASEPGETLRVTISSHEGECRAFEAVLALRRRELTRAAMTRVLVRYPPSTVATVARIYRQGLKLRLRGAPRYRRPSR